MIEDVITKVAKEVLKPRTNWSDIEQKLVQANAKALYTIFVGMDDEQFKLISICTAAKRAWDTLQTVHEVLAL